MTAHPLEPSQESEDQQGRAVAFETHRGLLFSLAYRMLGSVREAEDLVQEAWLRYAAVKEPVANPRAFLCTTVSRLALDSLRSARQRREVYVGPWLPEPLLETQRETSPDTAALAESLSMAFLLLLERLEPAERAAFLLREVFDFDYAEIAQMLDRSEGACRKLVSRAGGHLKGGGRRDVSASDVEAWVQRFTVAAATQDPKAMEALLAQDVTFVSDGGGRANAALRPIRGAEKVARLLLGLSRRQGPDVRTRLGRSNGAPAIILETSERLLGVFVLELSGGVATGFYLVLNPEKLQHLQPVEPPASTPA